MTSISSLKLYATQAHPCSYLDGAEATTVFIDPNAEMDAHLYGQLSHMGFRRSGPHVYRPSCESCSNCIPIRIAAFNFKPSRTQKRCVKTNQDLAVSVVPKIYSDEHYELYERYICARHNDGEMFPPSRKQYSDFLTGEWGMTRFMEFRDSDQKLLAVAVVDLLEQGLSAVYTYFSPEAEERSLGRFAILYQIDLARRLQLPFVYLGYWIKDCQKMNYKTEYLPYELLLDNNWRSFKTKI
ncbi:arginyltransferase [Teredinibacter waterburyi]|uniref:arginyltransferase n=1 Tax=Teredinibacter waterburyi TaxID=1500538 RepID=UPI00165EE732|nr:arginyltransferase [Teredinibacter waterburyi]